jgi:hypothetical protein
MSAQHRKSSPSAEQVKSDAKGQFRNGKGDSSNNGLASAEPRVLGDGEQEASAWNEGEKRQRDTSPPKRET